MELQVNVTADSMEEQSSDQDQSSDQAESGVYMNADLLDELMGSLATMYAKLLVCEKRKLSPDEALAEKYAERHDEILLLKESYPVDSASNLHNKAISAYARELSQVRLLLENQ